MFIAGRLCRCEYRVTLAEHILRDQCDLHRHQTGRVYEQYHDQRLKCTFNEHECNGYGRPCPDVGTPSTDSNRYSDADTGEHTRGERYTHGRRAYTHDRAWAAARAIRYTFANQHTQAGAHAHTQHNASADISCNAGTNSFFEQLANADSEGG
jgi:hypothetical protein